ncbi:MAG: hypothetical protein F9K30_17410 [Dechloromonas sp.]|nr:MAG: hypothetical protein F9K30_17410 [Dechloromonas sp.]
MSQQINLLLPELRPRFDWLALPVVGAIALAACVLVVLLAQFQAYRHARLSTEAAATSGKLLNLQQQVQALGESVGARKPNGELPAEISLLRSGVEQRREVLTFVGKPRDDGSAPGFSGMLQGFSRQGMEGVWLTGFALAPAAVEIRGRLLDPVLLPRYIARLNEDAAFSGRRFSALEMKGVLPAAEAEPKRSPQPLRPYTEFVLRTDGALPEETRR